MISTIKVHQPPPTPNPATRGATNCTLPLRRLDHLQYLDLTDCVSLEDSGLKMVVETCPQLLYLFLRRCTAITGKLKIWFTKLGNSVVARRLFDCWHRNWLNWHSFWCIVYHKMTLCYILHAPTKNVDLFFTILNWILSHYVHCYVF